MNIFCKVDNGVPTPGVRFVNPRTEAYNLLSPNINWDMTEAFDWNIAGTHIILNARVENALMLRHGSWNGYGATLILLPAAPRTRFYGGLTVDFNS